ncbi:hypothetical protein shim_09250 [Shimia sp. SK013]|uniref:hypothetical protein n=1 Tax=Shimia sp. SK013 TaxID=1389006 RepID=UPI0006B5159C|nr:hypothetical protein [Shimia sp. SK013]KPA22638.1 hypothetical protein shim_09250 [Shimia sp. SK013]
MDLSQTIFELIDMRSFSNLWYWIALAVAWSSASHWVLGVPWDTVLRARRVGGQSVVDLHDLVRINTNRILHIADVSGIWLILLAFFVHTSLIGLGFFYSVEFAQAVFLLMGPMTLVGAMSVRTARRVQAEESEGEDLWRRLGRHRFWVQLVGMLSIFVTSLWGMYQNFQISPLG